MTDKERPIKKSPGAQLVSTNRRAAMKALVWAAPAVVATAALKARAAQVSCTPNPPIED